MMRIENIINELEELIKADGYFENIDVVKAYPRHPAPTRNSRETVALGIDSIDMDSPEADGSARSGNIAVFADIFVPIKLSNSLAFEILEKLCSVLCAFNVLSVSAQRITFDTDTSSYLLKTVFTFNDEIEVN